MLASGGRGRDADDLARASLKHQKIAHTDMVSRDGDGVGREAALRRGSTRCWLGRTTTTYCNVNFFPILVVVVVMMTSTDDAFSSTVETMSQGVVVT